MKKKWAILLIILFVIVICFICKNIFTKENKNLEYHNSNTEQEEKIVIEQENNIENEDIIIDESPMEEIKNIEIEETNNSANSNNISIQEETNNSNQQISNNFQVQSNNNNNQNNENQSNQDIIKPQEEESCTPKKFDSNWFRPDFDTIEECSYEGSLYSKNYTPSCEYMMDNCNKTYYMLMLHDENNKLYDYRTIQKDTE